MKFDVYIDPSHGWCKVKKSLLAKIGVADKISPFSYQRGEYAYIEEDCDASTFCKALKENGIEYSFRHHWGNKLSRIRNYEPYKA